MFYKDLKTLFIHIPKTAGSSITLMLNNSSRYGNWGDSLRDYTKNDSREIGRICHCTAKNYFEKNDNFDTPFTLTEEEYKLFFKFAIVRNPLDRAASMHRYLIKEKMIDNKIDFKKFFLHWLPRELDDTASKFNYFVLPQFDFVSINNKIIIDKILYFENLKNDIEKIKEVIKIKSFFVKTNETDISYYPNLLKEKKIIRTIENLYKKDYENFYNI